MLTRRQKELYEYMGTYNEQEGVMPSYDEMMQALEIKSKSGVHRLICCLEERGYITRMPSRARAIRLLK